ncbi:MAG: hypothetical protein IJP54_03345 [Synergistaceae bacterium]|nr:hypothetical protein [Synergistaceae bacterium]
MCTLISALSAGASLFTGIAQARNARANAEAQANAMEANARNADILAHDAVERGGQDELRLRRSLAMNVGNQAVQAASSGVDSSSGSVIDARNASISEGEHDAEAIRFNAARERWGYLSQARNLNNQAAYARTAGKSAADNVLFGNLMKWGLDLGNTVYEQTRDPNDSESPLTDTMPEWVNSFGPEHFRRNGRRSR